MLLALEHSYDKSDSGGGVYWPNRICRWKCEGLILVRFYFEGWPHGGVAVVYQNPKQLPSS